MSAELRLWPAAVGLWVASALALSSVVPPFAIAGGPWVVAGLVIAVPSLRAAMRRHAHLLPALALVALVFAAGALNVVVRVAPLESSLLPEPGTSVIVEAVLDTDPRVVQGSVAGIMRGPPRVVSTVTATRLTWPRGSVEARLPMRLWTPIDSAALLPGTRISGRATVQPGDPAAGNALTLTMRTTPTVLDEPPVWQRVAGTLREGLRAAVADIPGEGAALLPGIVLGDTSTVPDSVATDMRTAGLSHLTAVSGANVSIVLGAALAVASVLRVRGRWRALVALLALLGFLVLVRPSPSVVRATAMGGVVVLALVAGGKRRGSPALAGAVLVLLLVDPWLSTSLGFALSAAATAGLLLLAPVLRRWLTEHLPQIPAGLSEALSVTIAAQVATAPLLVLMGASVGLGSVPANLMAEVVVAPATVLGVIATLLSPVAPALAHAIAIPAAACAQWIVDVAHVVATSAALLLPWPSGTPGALFMGAVMGGVATGVRYRRRLAPVVWALPRAPVACGVAIAVVGVIAIPRAASSAWPPPHWRAVACDVGQGDALVIRVDDDTAIVVDAGPRPDAIDRCLRDLSISRVAALVLTHFHADHVEGVPGVLRGRSVATVLVSPLAEPPEEAERVMRWCSEAQVPVEVGHAGDVRRAGNVTWRLLWPARLIRGEGSDPNNASVAAYVDADGVRLLLSGDIEPAAQAGLMAAVGDLPVDVLKVAHHGSRRQNPRFAAWTHARLAIISVGADNDYGHPAPETLAALSALGIPLLRTDQSGDIAVVLNSEGIGLLGSRS